MAHEQTFRIFHRHGSVIVMAKSETDKAVWLSSLEHQIKLKKTSHLKNVTASNRIVHEVSMYNVPYDMILPSPEVSPGGVDSVCSVDSIGGVVGSIVLFFA